MSIRVRTCIVRLHQGVSFFHTQRITHLPRGFPIILSRNIGITASYLDVPDDVNHSYTKDVLIKKIQKGEIEPEIILKILQEIPKGNLPHLSKVCSTALPLLQKNQVFQENYIQLCYLTNDTRTIRHLLELYLLNKSYNSETLAYIFSHFIGNYEHTFITGLFTDIVKLKKQLQPKLLEVVIEQLILHDTLFENLPLVIGQWVQAGYSVLPKSACLLLQQYFTHGTANEIRHIMEIISKCGLSDHYLVRSVELQNLIVSLELDLFNYKDRLMEIKQLISSQEELIAFYGNFLKFFSTTKGRTLQDLEYLLRLFAIDGFKLRNHLEFFPDILDFVVAHTFDISQVMQLLESTVANKSLLFDVVYLKKLYGAFVRYHPFEAAEFDVAFKKWVSSSALSIEIKESLSGLQIQSVTSKLTPYALRNDPTFLKPKKYKNLQWKTMQHKRDCQGRIAKDKDQLEFRVTSGFNDLISSGVSPDPKILLETYQRCSYDNKQILVELFKKTRHFSEYDIPLKLIELQEKNSKIALVQFIKSPDMIKINVNNKFKLARMLSNKHLQRESEKLLASIDEEQLPHHSRQLKLQLQLRNCELLNDFVTFNKLITEWPLQDIHVTPYIVQHCKYIQRKLILKLNSLNTKHDTLHSLSKFNSIFAKGDDLANIGEFFEAYPSMVEELRNSITGILDFTQHVKLRISEDKQMARKQMERMFEFFDKWLV